MVQFKRQYLGIEHIFFYLLLSLREERRETAVFPGCLLLRIAKMDMY